MQPLPVLEQLRGFADENDLALHLDGARIWNAHVVTGVPLTTYGSLFDTVSVCFSKGLGAPVGSMLLGTKEVIDQARVWRKRLGGGMREVGIIAAGAALRLKITLIGWLKTTAAPDNWPRLFTSGCRCYVSLGRFKQIWCC